MIERFDCYDLLFRSEESRSKELLFGDICGIIDYFGVRELPRGIDRSTSREEKVL
jgi:hypothetical protein